MAGLGLYGLAVKRITFCGFSNLNYSRGSNEKKKSNVHTSEICTPVFYPKEKLGKASIKKKPNIVYTLDSLLTICTFFKGIRD